MKEKVLSVFKEKYGDGGDIRLYFAPGRVNLIGEHTDYNGGHVFPCALTIGTYGAARKREDRKIRFYSMNFKDLGVIETSLDELTPDKKAGWTNYPKGVMWAFRGRGYEMDCGLDVVIYGDIPNGSGLSSSASLEESPEPLGMSPKMTISMVATAESWTSLPAPWGRRTMPFSWTPIRCSTSTRL